MSNSLLIIRVWEQTALSNSILNQNLLKTFEKGHRKKPPPHQIGLCKNGIPKVKKSINFLYANTHVQKHRT